MPGTRKKFPSPPPELGPSFAQMWFRLRDLINALFSEAGMENVAYVDKGGDDGAAQIGSLVNTFLTVQAAMTALAAAGYGEKIVSIGPGVFTEDLVWPNTDNLALIGSGANLTYLRNATDTHTLSIVAPAAGNNMHNALVRDLTIQNTFNDANAYALRVEGQLTGDAFDESGLRVYDCDITKTVGADNAAYFRCIGFLHLRGCTFGPRTGGNDVGMLNVASGWIETVFGKDLAIDYNSALAVPNADRGWIAMSNAIWAGSLLQDNIALVACGADVQVGAIGCALIDITDGGAGEWHGRLDYQGRVVGAAVLGAVWATNVGRANDPAFRFDGAIIGGALDMDIEQTTANGIGLSHALYHCLVYGATTLDTHVTAASSVVAELLHCTFKSTVTQTDDGDDAFSGSSLWKQSIFTPGNAITCHETAGGASDPYMDLRSAFFDGADLAAVTNSAGIDRSMIRGTAAAEAGPTNVAFVSLPTGTTAYSVATELAALAAGPVDISNKAAAGFTITRTGAAGTIDWVVLRPAP